MAYLQSGEPRTVRRSAVGHHFVKGDSTWLGAVIGCGAVTVRTVEAVVVV